MWVVGKKIILKTCGTHLQGVNKYVISYYVVGFPLVFHWFYYLKIVGLILPINFNFC